jgi:hypothetical protein
MKTALFTQRWYVVLRLPRAAPDLKDDGAPIKRIHTQQHDPSCRDANEPTARPSLDINVRADHGDISLALPYCFRGPITINTTHERIIFSPGLKPFASQLSDVLGERVYFIGERPRKGEWRGGSEDDRDVGMENTPEEAVDRLHVHGKHTTVWIGRIDEEKPGWWTSLWNWNWNWN